jgi:hypothetical protein
VASPGLVCLATSVKLPNSSSCAECLRPKPETRYPKPETRNPAHVRELNAWVFRFRVLGFGFRVYGFGFRVSRVGCERNRREHRGAHKTRVRNPKPESLNPNPPPQECGTCATVGVVGRVEHIVTAFADLTDPPSPCRAKGFDRIQLVLLHLVSCVCAHAHAHAPQGERGGEEQGGLRRVGEGIRACAAESKAGGGCEGGGCGCEGKTNGGGGCEGGQSRRRVRERAKVEPRKSKVEPRKSKVEPRKSKVERTVVGAFDDGD